MKPTIDELLVEIDELKRQGNAASEEFHRLREECAAFIEETRRPWRPPMPPHLPDKREWT
jgi:hypothetical protein